ncbi:hypothetical protein [uncultured Clostridium sp.]|nr:hypothetical protein [uncultured Clostridium sp.]
MKLSRYICSKYNINKIHGRGELNAANCPGKDFHFGMLKEDLGSGGAFKG